MKISSTNSPIKHLVWCLALITLFSQACQPKNEPVAYLFAYFTGNGPGQEQVHYAVSKDGFSYYTLNNNQPIVDAKDISVSGGVRDPHLLRVEEGWFYMVLTDLYVPEMGWRNTAMVMLKSKDLINWSHSVVDIPQTFPESFGDVYRVWAPQTFYDTEAKKYMLYWSMIQPEGRDIIYYAYANEDFTGLESEPQQLLYKKGACIDGDIVFKDGTYHLFFKNEDEDAKGIMLATSDKLTEGYEVQEGYVDQTENQVEGSGTFKLIGTEKYILMYDMYTSGKYQFCVSDDLKDFQVIDEDISMNFHPRHGSVLAITQSELDQLLEKWGKLDGLVSGSENPGVKEKNIVVEEGSIMLPLKPGTDLSQFDPQLEIYDAVTITPSGPQDFSNGSVAYQMTIGPKSETVTVKAEVHANPVLDGFYADPEIIYSEREQKYYLYPTSDGFTSWSGKYFEVFESEDLINWRNKGKILELGKDVTWADRNAWAPCAIEKKVDDGYKYYYYFTAAQQIGVAVADSPTGPFVDSGKALVDYKPEGIEGGQEIDPDVFRDPQSAKHYLYWGNGYMAVAELNDDMITIKKETLKVMTPDRTYREGTEVFYRDGTYYFMWSEDDTRSPNYKVRYATSDSPMGPLTIPEDNIVIQRNEEQQIHATGHNSVIYSKENDQWYLVYHRFTRPDGLSMGRSAGYNREVCIDALNFNEDGSIVEVTPTLKGLVAKK